jgi:hypothetical protein
MHSFCTYFDRNYFVKALCLYRSLKRHCAEFRLYALCLDDESYETIKSYGYSDLVPISLSEFEAGDEALLRAKANRSQIEYYFTCTSSLCLYILKNDPSITLLTYLDSDLYFYSDPAPIYRELERASIGLIEHRFARQAEFYSGRLGRFNVGWVSFRRDENGLAALQWWREQCLEWCHDRVEPGRFADQKYLDQFPDRFAGVVAIKHKGANLAAWNVGNYRISRQHDEVLLDDQPLIFFHFARFKEIRPWLYKTSFGPSLIRPSRTIRRYIFNPYILEMTSIASRASLKPNSLRKFDAHAKSLRRLGRDILRLGVGLFFREYVLFVGNKVY